MLKKPWRMCTVPAPLQVVQVLALGAGLGAAAVAGLAAVPARDADLRLLAGRRLLQRDLHRVAEVVAAVDLLLAAARAPAAAEDVAEDVAEGLGEAAEPLRSGAAAPAGHVGVDAGMAELVVGGPLLGVGEHLVGLLGLLEFLLRLLGRRVLALVAVRVVLHGQLAVGLLDVFLGRVLRHAQDVVVVALGHRIGSLCKRVRRAEGMSSERGGLRRQAARLPRHHFLTSLKSASTTLSSSAFAEEACCAGASEAPAADGAACASA
jgi:hypothetical protein